MGGTSYSLSEGGRGWVGLLTVCQKEGEDGWDFLVRQKEGEDGWDFLQSVRRRERMGGTS